MLERQVSALMPRRDVPLALARTRASAVRPSMPGADFRIRKRVVTRQRKPQ
jgi:hypothetical protein